MTIWKAIRIGESARYEIIDEGKGLVAVTDDNHAALVAAAPAMLAVLRDIVTYVSPGEDIPLARMLDEARAAVDSAESR